MSIYNAPFGSVSIFNLKKYVPREGVEPSPPMNRGRVFETRLSANSSTAANIITLIKYIIILKN